MDVLNGLKILDAPIMTVQGLFMVSLGLNRLCLLLLHDSCI